MADVNLVRQKVQQARTHLAKGELVKARALLKGLDHPKAQALLADTEAQIAQQKPTQSKFPLVPILLLVTVCIVLVFVVVFVLPSNRNPRTTEHLPTLIPTSDCTSETVRAWWGIQDVALDGFVADASSASRTMPSERLTERISSLRQFRMDFPTLPECASAEMEGATHDLLQAMNNTIAILERWSNGTADGTQTSIDLQLAEQALRDARTRARGN